MLIDGPFSQYQIDMNTRARRSRKGCDTCRAKKVKCDEERPRCARCKRLNLTCNWSEGGPSLRDRRRGYGLLRTRDETWAPPPILPIGNLLENTSVHGTMEELPLEPFPEHIDTSLVGVYDLEWWTSLASEGSSQSWLLQQIGETNNSIDSIDDFEIFNLASSNNSTTIYDSSFYTPTYSPNVSLSNYHMSLPNSLTLNVGEHEALRHYQTTFSLYRTTKDPNWSTHKVLLDLGSQNTMIMHLLLAVSINDNSLRRCDESSSIAQEHFQAGAMMLIKTMGGDSEIDHVSLMAAYFFLYLYMSKRKSVASQRLQQLSLNVKEYVRKYELDRVCVNTHQTQSKLGVLTTMKEKDRSVLARLIMWTFDEDVKCSFQGSGGHLAKYLTANGTKDVYQASRNALGSHWGVEYPSSQILDDDQNSTVLEFLWAMMPLWQDVNDLTQESEPIASDLESHIEQTFSILEQKYASVFQLSNDNSKPRARVLVNADYDVILFNALRVYYFRSTITNLAIETPPNIQSALKTLLTIIQRTFTSKSTELHDRLQWPLFLAGIETSDSIYREWIFSRLTSSRVSAALQRTLDAQSSLGVRLRMSEIRNLLCENENTILRADNSFLNSIQAF